MIIKHGAVAWCNSPMFMILIFLLNCNYLIVTVTAFLIALVVSHFPLILAAIATL